MRTTGKLAVAAATIALALSATTAHAAPPKVLVVGDSLQELAAPYLEQHLSDVDLTINAEGGFNSFQIFDLFKESYDPSHSVIVFDGGTNDNPNYPEILAGNLQQVAEIVGDRCMVVPTIHGFTVEGVGNEGKNRVVAQFAASRPGTTTPDWAGAVAQHPELMQADNLHPIAEGADLRAQLIAEGVRGCLSEPSEPRPTTPVLDERPEMGTVEKLTRRQATLLRGIVSELTRQVSAQVAERAPSLAAILALTARRLSDDA